jgi:hypothetical protein
MFDLPPLKGVAEVGRHYNVGRPVKSLSIVTGGFARAQNFQPREVLAPSSFLPALAGGLLS